MAYKVVCCLWAARVPKNRTEEDLKPALQNVSLDRPKAVDTAKFVLFPHFPEHKSALSGVAGDQDGEVR